MRRTDQISLLGGFLKSRSKVGVSFSECFPFYEYFEPELQAGGTNPAQIIIVSLLDFGEDDKRWQSIRARQINREILPMLQGISQSSLSNAWVRWLGHGFVLVLFRWRISPATRASVSSFDAYMHQSVIIVIYAQSWNPWLLNPESDTLREEEATAGQGSVYDCRGFGVRLMLERVMCKSMWCGNIMNSADELMFPVWM